MVAVCGSRVQAGRAEISIFHDTWRVRFYLEFTLHAFEKTIDISSKQPHVIQGFNSDLCDEVGINCGNLLFLLYVLLLSASLVDVAQLSQRMSCLRIWRKQSLVFIRAGTKVDLNAAEVLVQQATHKLAHQRPPPPGGPALKQQVTSGYKRSLSLPRGQPQRAMFQKPRPLKRRGVM